MHENEKNDARQDGADGQAPGFCCGMPMGQGMPECCKAMMQGDDGESMMSQFMEACKAFQGGQSQADPGKEGDHGQ